MEFRSIIQSETPVLVDFYAEWCSPCKAMKPILQQVKHETGDSLRIIKIDVDRNPHVAKQFKIQGVPTLKLFKNGKVLWSGSGVIPAQQLINIVNKQASQFQE